MAEKRVTLRRDWWGDFLRRIGIKPPLVPLFPCFLQMREKDAELYAEIRPMSVASGIARWREVYPEDFEDFAHG